VGGGGYKKGRRKIKQKKTEEMKEEGVYREEGHKLKSEIGTEAVDHGGG